MLAQVTLNVTGSGPRFAPLSGDILKEAQAHLAAWRAAETIKAATAKAKNDLESYIISTREKLETEEALQQVRVGSRPVLQASAAASRCGARGWKV